MLRNAIHRSDRHRENQAHSGVQARQPSSRPTPTAAGFSAGSAGKPAGTPSVAAFSVLAALVMAQQVGSKVLRDALFLAQASASELPRALLFGSLLSAPLVLGAALLSTRLGPRRVAAGLLALNGLLFGVEWLLLPRAPLATAWLVYLHVVALGGTTLSTFFANVSEFYDPHRARKASVRVTAGAAVGGATGGLVVLVSAGAWGHTMLMPWLASLNVVCALALGAKRFWPPQAASKRAAPRTGLALATVGRSQYVRSIAYLVILTQFSGLLLDFNFKRQAAESLGSGVELVQLLTAFHTATALIATLVQLTLASFALERLGLAGTLAVLPLSLLLGGALGPLLPRLWGAVGLRGVSSVLESSLFRSAYEPLYTPLSQRARRSLKTVIDVAAGRFGEALGSLALLGIAAVWPLDSGLPVRSLALGAAALSLLLSLHMHSRYVSALAQSLRKGSVRMKVSDAHDSTTRLTLSQTHIEIERSQLLAEIAAQRLTQPPPANAALVEASGERAGASAEWLAGESAAAGSRDVRLVSGARARVAEEALFNSFVPAATAAPAVHEDGLQLQAAVAELLSGDRARVSALLARGPLDPRLVGFAIALLEQPQLVEPISAALVAVIDRVAGQLVDALHDTTLPPPIRRRLPRILQASRQPMAAQALAAALRAPERILRYRAAGALATMSGAQPDLRPTAALVFECVHSELAHAQDPLSMQHIFLLLSLALEREPLWLAYTALHRGDERQRGTALEYLHSTLPEPLRHALVAWIEAYPDVR